MPSDRTTSYSSSTDCDSPDLGSAAGPSRSGSGASARAAAAAARRAANPLQRGSACLACRKRKMKCDATHPVCRQCVKANRIEECDYDDGRQKSRTQILQEKISKLETRIRELEGEEDSEVDPFGEQQLSGIEFGGDLFDAGAAEAFMDLEVDPTSVGFGAPGPFDDASSTSGYDAQHFAHNAAFNTTGAGAAPSFAPVLTHSPQIQPQPQAHASSSSYGTDPFFAGTADALGMSAFTTGVGLGERVSVSPSGSGSASGSGSGSGSGSWASVPPLPPQQQQQYFDYLAPSMGAGSPGSPGPSRSSAHGWASIPSGEALSMPMPGYAQQQHQQHPYGDALFVGGGGPGVYPAQQGVVDAALFGVVSHSHSQSHAHSNSQFQVQAPPQQQQQQQHYPSLTQAQPQAGPSTLTSTSGSILAAHNAASRHHTSSGANNAKLKSVWERDVLRRGERQVLVDIFLPHARQCGLALSPARLCARMRVADPSGVVDVSEDDEPVPPPAHPCLAHAIYLLAAHFSASSSSSTGAALVMTNLTQYEPHFLARALRGIAAALEEGEAAAGGGARARSRSRRGSSRASSVASGNGSGSSASSASGSPATQYTLPGGGGMRKGFGSPVTPDPEDDFYGPFVSASAASGATPDAATPLLDAVQASALLAVYFFGKARLLEGYYHVSAAARLAIALGLHQIRTRRWRLVDVGAAAEVGAGEAVPAGFAFAKQAQASSSAWASPSGGERWAGTPSSSGSGSSGGGAGAVQLPPAVGPRAHAERVAAFWAVFAADRVWAVATGLPSSLPDDAHPQLRIESVWPWDPESEAELESEGASLVSGDEGAPALGALGSLYGPPAPSLSGENAPAPTTQALHAKAAAFFEKAARVSAMQTDPSYWATAQNLIHALNAFIAVLPAITVPIPSSTTQAQLTVDPELALVHTLAHAALLQLHHPRVQAGAPGARVAATAAAKASVHVVRALLASPTNNPNSGLNDAGTGTSVLARLDPAMGTAWMCVADSLLRVHSGCRPVVHEQEGGYSGAEAEAEADLDAVLAALRELGRTFPIALYQAQRIEQARAAHALTASATLC